MCEKRVDTSSPINPLQLRTRNSPYQHLSVKTRRKKKSQSQYINKIHHPKSAVSLRAGELVKCAVSYQQWPLGCNGDNSFIRLSSSSVVVQPTRTISISLVVGNCGPPSCPTPLQTPKSRSANEKVYPQFREQHGVVLSC